MKEICSTDDVSISPLKADVAKRNANQEWGKDICLSCE